MITGKINLAQLVHGIKKVKTAKGEEDCLIIPIAQNKLFKSEKGNVYLDFAGFEIAPEKRKGDDTHLIVQSFDQATRDANKAANIQSPILGNMRASDYAAEALPQVAPEFTNADFEEGGDDLPW